MDLYGSHRAIREGRLTEWVRLQIAEGKYDAAEQELIRAIDAARRYLGEKHPETLGCILAFIELYEAWGKPDEAERWRAELSRLEAHPRSGESAAPLDPANEL